MNNLHKISLLIIGATSILFSRMLFVFFDDPEGANLLVTMVTATFVFALSYGVHTRMNSDAFYRNVFTTILIQLVIVFGLYALLK